MKKIVVLGLIMGVLATSTTAYAVNKQNGFIDTNNDGVCDMQGNNGCEDNYVDENNDGVCDNKGRGKNFVDNNQDGECDMQGQMMSAGQGRRCGQGQGRGMGQGGCR